jgi:hypothetical protein
MIINVIGMIMVMMMMMMIIMMMMIYKGINNRSGKQALRINSRSGKQALLQVVRYYDDAADDNYNFYYNDDGNIIYVIYKGRSRRSKSRR